MYKCLFKYHSLRMSTMLLRQQNAIGLVDHHPTVHFQFDCHAEPNLFSRVSVPLSA